MKKKQIWFSLAEVIISILIISLFLLGSYQALGNFYNIISHIDSNINWLNMSKTAIDEIINIRNRYFVSFPFNWWEKFVNDYWTGTFKFSNNKCSIMDDLSDIYLCNINDIKNEYEWPLDNLWEITNNTNGIHFYRKIDIDIENNFYLKNIDRIKTLSGEYLIFKFTDEIYNHNSMVLLWDFENNNLTLLSNWLDVNYFNINWVSSDWILDNLSNKNLRYSKILEYNSGSIITDGDSLLVNNNWNNYIFEFVDELPSLTWTWIIPIQISDDINKNYLNLCNEINKISILNCDFNYIFQDNFYTKLIWIEKELSWIDFWNNYSFSFSWSNNNEIWINIIWNPIPYENTDIFINPFWDIKNIKNKSNKNDLLSIISDSTSWLWVEIPNIPNLVWEINTNTWFSSLLKIKSTTLSYEWDYFIDSFSIESKIWDINRYQNYNE